MTELTLEGSALLTNSRMQTFKTCGRKHFYQYEQGIRPSTSADFFRLGSAVHTGIDVWNKTASTDMALHDATTPYFVAVMQATTAELATAIEIERETVVALLNGYFAAWAWDRHEDAEHPLTPVEIVASELSFDLPITNPETGATSRTFRVAGKIDGIVRLKDGRLAVMEHKTTGDSIDSGSDYWLRLRIDHQISLYMVAAKELGYDVQTVLYNVIRKPSIAPKQIPLLDSNGAKIVEDMNGVRVMKKDGTPRESGDADKGYFLKQRREAPDEFGHRLAEDILARPEFYYARQEIPRLTADLDEFRWELWQQAQAIREAQRANRWIRNSGACLNMGRCPYLSICHNALDPNALPAGFVRVANIHPELENPE